MFTVICLLIRLIAFSTYLFFCHRLVGDKKVKAEIQNILRKPLFRQQNTISSTLIYYYAALVIIAIQSMKENLDKEA